MRPKDIVWMVIVSVFLGYVVYFNIGDKMYTYPNIWPPEREALRMLNRRMKDDKSQRLGIAVITEQETYISQSLNSEKVQMVAGFVEVPPPPPNDRWKKD